MVDNALRRRQRRDGRPPSSPRWSWSSPAPTWASRRRPTSAPGEGEPPTCWRSTPTPGSAPGRWTRCWRRSTPAREVAVAGPRLLLAGRLARSRRQALLPHSAERARPLQRPRRAAAGVRAGSPPTPRPGSSPGQVDAVNGAFMLMRRAAFERSGASTRATGCTWRTSTSATGWPRRGWVSWYEPAATVIHIKGGTTGRRRSPRLVLGLSPGHVPLLPRALRGRPLAARERRGLRRHRAQARRRGRSVGPAPQPGIACASAAAASRPARADRAAPRPPDRAPGPRRPLPRARRSRPRTPPRLRSTPTCPALSTSSRASTPGSRRGSEHTPLAQHVAAAVADQVVLARRAGAQRRRVLVRPPRVGGEPATPPRATQPQHQVHVLPVGEQPLVEAARVQERIAGEGRGGSRGAERVGGGPVEDRNRLAVQVVEDEQRPVQLHAGGVDQTRGDGSRASRPPPSPHPPRDRARRRCARRSRARPRCRR